MVQAGEALARGAAAAVVFRQGGWVGARSILAPGPWSDVGPVRLLSDGKRK